MSPSTRRSRIASRQPPHQHVVVHAVEELLQVHVHHEAAAFLDVALRLAHGVVRAASRPETVAVLRKGRIEPRLQDLQQRLLDEPVEHRRDAELAHPAAALRNLLAVVPAEAGSSPRAAARGGAASARAGNRATPSTVIPSMPGLPLFFSLASARPAGCGVSSTASMQVARSRALGLARRRRRFVAPLPSRGFTPTRKRELQLPGHLRPGASETHGFVALLSVRPFAAREATTTTSADFSLRLYAARRPFRRKARSPQVRTRPFTARPPDLRRLSLGHRSFAVIARSPRSASPRIRFLYIGPRFRSPLPSHGRSPFRSCGSLRSRWPAFERTFTSKVSAHAGRTERRAAAGDPPSGRLPRQLRLRGAAGSSPDRPAASCRRWRRWRRDARRPAPADPAWRHGTPRPPSPHRR